MIRPTDAYRESWGCWAEIFFQSKAQRHRLKIWHLSAEGYGHPRELCQNDEGQGEEGPWLPKDLLGYQGPSKPGGFYFLMDYSEPQGCFLQDWIWVDARGCHESHCSSLKLMPWARRFRRRRRRTTSIGDYFHKPFQDYVFQQAHLCLVDTPFRWGWGEPSGLVLEACCRVGWRMAWIITSSHWASFSQRGRDWHWLWYTWDLYAHLDKCTANVTWSLGRYNVVMSVDSCFLQMFLYECFGALAPKRLILLLLCLARLKEWLARGGWKTCRGLTQCDGKTWSKRALNPWPSS